MFVSGMLVASLFGSCREDIIFLLLNDPERVVLLRNCALQDAISVKKMAFPSSLEVVQSVAVAGCRLFAGKFQRTARQDSDLCFTFPKLVHLAEHVSDSVPGFDLLWHLKTNSMAIRALITVVGDKNAYHVTRFSGPTPTPVFEELSSDPLASQPTLAGFYHGMTSWPEPEAEALGGVRVG